MNVVNTFKDNWKKICIAFVISLILVLLLLTTYSIYIRSNENAEKSEENNKQLVVLISLDGLGSNLIMPEDSFLYSLLQNEDVLSTLEMKSLLQSETLPNHVSMVTGLNQLHHKVDFNFLEDTTPTLPFKTLFDYALEHDYSYYAFLTKQKLQYLLGDKEGSNIVIKEEDSSDVLDEIDSMIETNGEKVFVFIHFRDVDIYGHKYGWNSNEQKKALKILDDNLELLVKDLREEFDEYGRYFVFASDHGGEGTQHSNGCSACRRIPLIVLTDDSAPKYQFKDFHFAIYDVTCVILKLMKITDVNGLDCTVDTDFTDVSLKLEI